MPQHLLVFVVVVVVVFFFRGAWLVCLFNGILVPLRTRIDLRGWILSALVFLACCL